MIPLGPLRIGDVLGGAFATLGRYGKQLFGVGAAAFGGALAVMVAAALIAYSAVADHVDRLLALDEGDPADRADWVPVVVAFGSVALVALITGVLATALTYTAVPAVLQEAVLGRRTTFSAIWRRAWSRMASVIGTVVLTGLIAMVPVLLGWMAFVALIVGAFSMDGGGGAVALVVVGFLGFVATAPLALWLWVKFSLAPSVAVFESQGPVEAMRRSFRLVRGDWWRILGITLLAGLMAMVASYVIQMPFTFIGMFSGMLGSMSLGDDPNTASVLLALSGYAGSLLLGQMVSQLVVSTFPPLVTGLLYVDRRIRTENLGPVLAEAAAEPPQYEE
ncbi:hypothetical protein [Streptomyces sp. NPDC057682]|uniref:DUF7847 domain-containing protein n=1 Tax=unclassified Streptomyces TaxID=2593676 RepID=UPI00365EDBC9